MNIVQRRISAKILPAAVVLVAIGALAYALIPRADSSNSEVAVGMIDTWEYERDEPVPDFALADVRNPGAVIRVSDFRGKTVILNWFATWCGPCRAELPDFQEAYVQFDGDIVVLAINLQESPEAALKMLDEAGTSFPAVLDADGAIATHFGVRGMPTTIFIDKDGIARMSGAGRITNETLYSELARLGHTLESSTP